MSTAREDFSMRDIHVDGLTGEKTAALALATARDQAAGLPNNVVFFRRKR
jgi:hypothetical protein